MDQLIQVAFIVGRGLFILAVISAVRDAWRYRDAHRRDIMFLMTSYLTMLYITPGMGQVGYVCSTGLRLAFPYLLLRLVRHFRNVPTVLQVGAIAAIAAGIVVAMEITKEQRQTFRLILYGYLAVLVGYSAIALAAEARRASGVTAKRLILAATGAGMLAGAHGVLAFGRLLSGGLDVAVTQIVLLVDSGLLVALYLAFSTPRRLRSAWQRAEQARYLSDTADRDAEERGRSAAADLYQAAIRIAGNAATLVALRDDPGASDLVVRTSSVPELMGATVVTRGPGLISRACQTGMAVLGPPVEAGPDIAGALAALGAQVLVAPVATNSHTWGAVLVVQRHGSLFPDDDLLLLAQLGRYSATALDHAYLIVQARERERRIADRRLREAESRMSLMLDSIKDYAMFVVDEHGGVVAWHIGAEHIFGYSSAEMLQEPAAPLYNMTRADFEALLDEAHRFGFAEQEGECRRRDGERFVGTTVVRPLENEDDAPPGFVAVTRDVTERRKLEERLRQSQKLEAIGQLAGGIAHDFNNLLTAILGYADWLGRDFAGDETRLQQIGEITKAGERAAGLTRQLLAFSRREMHQPAAVNLSRLVHDLLPMLRRIIGEHVDIVHEPAAEPALVLGDRSQIEQVVMNLAVNARDAMPAGGRLTIRTTAQWLDEAATGGEVLTGRYVLLDVSDTGTGIDPATQRRMFEPFFTTKEFGSGTGLGLATVYGIVKQMDGIIRVQTEIGAGTSFRLYFPETRLREAAVAPAGPASVTAQGHETVLLVEDDEVVRVFLMRVLERSGYRVLVAERPDAALEMIAAHPDPIHMVVTDVVLPGGTGPELVKALARIRPGLPVLYISGYADAVLAQQGSFPKASHFLQKPFSAEDLLERVRQILGADPFARAGFTP